MSIPTPVNSVQSTTSIDSWENRIKSAATFMNLTPEVVESSLKSLGVEKEPAGLEMLSDESITPFGDLRTIFCDGLIKVPIAKVRLAMKYLRSSKDSPKTDTIDPELVSLKTKYGIKMKIEDVNPVELLEYYHPEQPNHPITIALKKVFGDKKVIAYKSDSSVVDIEATSNYITDLAQGFPEQETIDSDGMLVRLYAIGQIPNQIIEEDPLFEGSPLKRGRSIVNRINWENVQLSIRQFCRIIVARNDLDVSNRFNLTEFMRLVKLDSDDFNKNLHPNGLMPNLREVYPEAYLEYRELAQKNELPKLTMTMDQSNSKKQNPFNINRKY